MSAPLISVIVCTYKRAPLLALCLESLREQHLGRGEFEIIVVANEAGEATAGVIERHRQALANLRSVHEPRPNLSLARNIGCELAQGEYLAYIDDDARLPPEHLAHLARIIRDHAPDIIGGPVYPWYSTPKPAWFKDKYETKKFAEQSGFSRTRRVTGANFCIRKATLIRVGMFDLHHGMQGDKYVIGDERKVLESYLAATPEAEQKVYYALECYVRHHVPAHKLTRRSMFFRYYTGGRALTEIYRDIAGLSESGWKTLRQLIIWPWRLALALAQPARRPPDADWTETTALACYELGTLVTHAQTAARRQAGKLARRLGRRRPASTDSPNRLHHPDLL